MIFFRDCTDFLFELKLGGIIRIYRFALVL